MRNEPGRPEVEALFERALEMPGEEREKWLSELADQALANRVKVLLAAHARGDGILDDAGPSEMLGAALREPTRFGPYRLVRPLGRGGMGEVYLARRHDAFMRQVAVKVLRSGISSGEAVRRFHTERQIMASLDHPGIAQLLDGGVSDDGLPYLVMEFVEGLPVTEYCQREGLTLEQRLDLFRKICAAVHHAHCNLVIHRDLKPSNILVRMDGEPRLLDFGIAKLLQPVAANLGEPPTDPSARALTPDYASPEQLRGEPLTTASDVYSLGVLLYEMLCGVRPFPSAGGAAEVVAALRERDPEPPSAHVSGEEAKRIQGDLDEIALMALRREPRRRYGSVAQLSDDVARFLAGGAVVAQGDSRAYRTRKFLRRHRVEAVAAAVVLASLVGGLGTAIRQATIARRERDLAGEALSRAEATADFLMALFESDDVGRGVADTLSATTMLARGLARADELKGFPALQSRLFHVVGTAYQGLGEYEEAEAAMRRARQFGDIAHIVDFGTDGVREMADLDADLADILRHVGRYREARDVADEAYELRVDALGPTDADVATSLVQLGGLAIYFGELSLADSLTRAGIDVRRAALGPDDPAVTSAIEALAVVSRRRGHVDEAEALLNEAGERRRASEGADSREYATAMLRLATLLSEDRGDHAGAEALYRRALEIYSPDDPEASSAMEGLGQALAAQGRYPEAIEVFRTTVAARRARFGPRHDAVANGLHGLGSVLFEAGDLDGAEAAEREALAAWREALGPEHAATAYALLGLAKISTARGDYDAGEVSARQALSIRRDALGPGNLLIPLAEAELADVLAAEGEPAEAETLLLGALDQMREQLPETHRDVRDVHARLARLYEGWGKKEEAARHRAAAGGPPPEQG